jgi:hypothetical protein
VTIAVIAIAALLGVALVVQVVYARAYWPNSTRAVRVVWGVNIALLLAVVIGLLYYAFAVGVS